MKRFSTWFLFAIGFAALGLSAQASPAVPLTQDIQALVTAQGGKSAVYILEEGETALFARAWLVEQAVASIDVQYFIWSTDNIGRLAAQALLAAADRGVTVRVIVDDFLIDASNDSLVALASHPNIHIKIYNPKLQVGANPPQKLLRTLLQFRAVNQRMHNKTFIVDKQVAITGGRNMADEYYNYDRAYNFRDRDALLLGPVAGVMADSFQSYWDHPISVPVEDLLDYKFKRLSPENAAAFYAQLHAYAQDPVNYSPVVRAAIADIPAKLSELKQALLWEDVSFIADKPGKNDRVFRLDGGGDSTAALVQLLGRARNTVTIQSPYLVIPDAGMALFKKLLDAGVKIRINTNSLASTDNLLAFGGYLRQRNKLLKMGIEVYEFRPDSQVRQALMQRSLPNTGEPPVFALHAKTLVVDGRWTYVGTFNLDPRSANLNTEVGIIVDSAQLAQQVEASMLNDMADGNSWNLAEGKPDHEAGFKKRAAGMLYRLLPIDPVL